MPNEEDTNEYRELPALSPVIQGQFKGVRVCGIRGGLPFIEANRVEKNGKCPPKILLIKVMNAAFNNTVVEVILLLNT